MTKNEYNGWYNYETWLLKLWQDNSQGSQIHWQEEAVEVVRIHGTGNEAVRVMSDILKEEYEEMAAELSGVTGFWADLIGAALSEVNWREIAEHLVEDVEVEEVEATHDTP